MSVTHELRHHLQAALKACYDCPIPADKVVLQPAPKGFIGSHTLITYPLSKVVGVSPPLIADTVGTWLMTHCPTMVASYQVVKGFLNLTLHDTYWLQALDVTLRNKLQRSPTGRTMVVEFSCPNTNKPLHLGHLRNNFLGHAMAAIWQAVGHTVHKVNLINDRGIHICKSMVAYQRYGEGTTPSSTGIKGDHFVGCYYVRFEQAYRQEVATLTATLGDAERAAKEASILQEAQQMVYDWEQGEQAVRALWERMNGWVHEGLEATYARTGITFDKTYYESETYLRGKEMVGEGLAKGIFYAQEDGSVWCDLTTYGLGKKLLLRGNGTSVYITQDMGTADLRYTAYGFDEHVYVVGSEQAHHFKVLFALLTRLGHPAAGRLRHLSYGMVHLPSGKMKSREGTVVDADNLLDKMATAARMQGARAGKGNALPPAEEAQLHEVVGQGALKYFLLKVGPAKELLFDPAHSIDLQGNTGPFIQYAHARICTLLHKAGISLTLGLFPERAGDLLPAEHALVVALASYDEALDEAATQGNPARLAQHAYEVAKAYNHLYAVLPITREQVVALRTRRYYLSQVTAHCLARAMKLLGITLPERM